MKSIRKHNDYNEILKEKTTAIQSEVAPVVNILLEI